MKKFKNFLTRVAQLDRLRTLTGFTFIEVMVSVAILAVGFVTIYQAFFVSLGNIEHTDYRLYANLILDQRVTEMQEKFARTGEVSLGRGDNIQKVKLNNKEIQYLLHTDIQGVEGLNDIIQVDMLLSWRERGRNIALSRTIYMARK